VLVLWKEDESGDYVLSAILRAPLRLGTKSVVRFDNHFYEVKEAREFGSYVQKFGAENIWLEVASFDKLFQPEPFIVTFENSLGFYPEL
jgi:alpha-acetolactate decarboxylase